MLINCFSCGKSVSAKKDLCAYCKSDISEIASELKARPHGILRKQNMSLKEKYKGTILSFVMR